MKRLLVVVLAVVFVMGSSLLYAQETKAAATAEVLEVKLGKAVENREIVDETSAFALNDKVFLWLKIAGAEGQSITVTWKHGEQIYSTELSIGGSPWRTWAYKTAAMTGDWSVSVADKEGNVLKEMTFSVGEEGK
jgi:hypothetical protein